MPYFGDRSKRNLMTCDQMLQDLFLEVVGYHDCAVICGYRGETDQNEAYYGGRSKLKFPQSRHNQVPSMAVDVVPWHHDQPHIRWEDRTAFYHFCGVVRGIAAMRGYPIRWGGDWDRDFDLADQSFFDLPHFEIVIIDTQKGL